MTLEVKQNQKLRIDPFEHRSFTMDEKIQPSAIKIYEHQQNFVCHFQKPIKFQNKGSLDDILDNTSTLYFGFSNNANEPIDIKKKDFLLDRFFSPNWRVVSRDCLSYEKDDETNTHELDFMYIGKVKLKLPLKNYSVQEGYNPDFDYDQTILERHLSDFIYYDEKTPILVSNQSVLDKLEVVAFEKIPCIDGSGSRPPTKINH